MSHLNSFGWIPDRPDHRDFLYSAIAPKVKLPSKIDLRSEDSFLGTSAGARLALHLASGSDLDQLFEQQSKPVLGVPAYFAVGRLAQNLASDAPSTGTAAWNSWML